MARSDHVRFDLEVGALKEADLVVTGVHGREGLSVPFAFDVRIHAASGRTLAIAELLAAEARLALRRPPGAERIVHGEVGAARLDGVRGGVPQYVLRIVPRLARLAHVARSRVFQDRTAADVVLAVLDGHGVKRRSALSGAYAVRPYVVQHQETDLAFVSRLLEEEGIGYLFEHGAGGHELVLFDGAEPGPRLAPAIPQRTAEHAGGERYAHEVAVAARLAPTGAALRDHDLEKPELDLGATAGKKDLERYEFPGGYVAPAEGRRRAAVRLAQARARAGTCDGATNVLELVPGASFEVEGAGKLLCVSVSHEGVAEDRGGVAGATYRNAFEAVAAGAPWRPPRRTPRGDAPGLETATVVGPGGEEIHVDAHGRVKVQLHWDREGKGDDRSSCWVPVAQRWAGPGMGASVVPRIGQEVLVRFLAGDGDQPVVVGAVYDGVNRPPVELPNDKTRSTRRSSSSPGGDGNNELRIEDTAGREELHLHAQKDLDAVVEHDRAAEIRGCEDVAIDADLTQTVAGDRTGSVALDAATAIGGAETLTVLQAFTDGTARDASLNVGAVRTVTVAQARMTSVGLGSAETVGGAAAHTIGGAYAVNVGLAENIAVGGARTEQVVGAKLEVVARDRDETVKGDRTTRTLGSDDIVVDGAARILAHDARDEVGQGSRVEVTADAALHAGTTELRADQLTVKVGGRELLVMTKAGAAVALALSNLTVEGSASIALKGSKITKIQGGGASGKGPAQRSPPDKGAVTVRFDIDPADARHVGDRFVLEATDGSYRQVKTIKDDKKDGDRMVDIEFTDAPLDRKFRLKVTAGANELLLMDEVAFNDITAALHGGGAEDG